MDLGPRAHHKSSRILEFDEAADLLSAGQLFSARHYWNIVVRRTLGRQDLFDRSCRQISCGASTDLSVPEIFTWTLGLLVIFYLLHLLDDLFLDRRP